jgi:hydrogenase maturation protease
MNSTTNAPAIDDVTGLVRRHPIVIGVGNRDRGDDAAGPLVCDRLRARLGAATDIRTFVCEGSILDLALHWDHDDDVVIVDAVQPGAEPGRIVSFDASVDPLPTPGAVSTHQIDVSVAIELARAIGRMPARLVLIGIEAEQVHWGAPPGAAVDAAIDTVVELLVLRRHPILPGTGNGPRQS